MQMIEMVEIKQDKISLRILNLLLCRRREARVLLLTWSSRYATRSKSFFYVMLFFGTFETSLKSPIWLTMNMVPSQKKLISFEHGPHTPQT